jgi:hypothetical protein
LCQFGLRQIYVGGSEIFLQPLHLGRARDRYDPWPLLQQPCQSDLRKYNSLCPGNTHNNIDQRLVGAHGVRRETREPGTHIASPKRTDPH